MPLLRSTLSDPVAARRVLFMLVGLMVLANTVSVVIDATPIWGDAIGKFEAAMNIRNSLLTDLSAAWDAYFNTYIFPPLLKVLGGVFLLPYPTIPEPDLVILSIQLFYIALLLGVYGTVRSLCPREGPGPALLAAFLTGTTPTFLGLSKAYMHDLPLAGTVWLSLALLLRSDLFRNRRTSFLFGLSCGLGLLTKQAFVIFLGLPLVLVLIQAFLKKTDRDAMAGGLTWAAAGGMITAGPWYLVCFPQTYIQNYVLNQLPQTLGDLHLTGFYFKTLPSVQLGWVLTILAVLAAARLLVSPTLLRRYRWLPAGLICFLLPLVYLSSGPNLEARYSLPALPLLLILIALAVGGQPPGNPGPLRRRLRSWATVGVIGWGAFLLLYIDFVPQAWHRRVPDAIQQAMGLVETARPDHVYDEGQYLIKTPWMDGPVGHYTMRSVLEENGEPENLRLVVYANPKKPDQAEQFARVSRKNKEPWEILFANLDLSRSEPIGAPVRNRPHYLIVQAPVWVDVIHQLRLPPKRFHTSRSFLNREGHFLYIKNLRPDPTAQKSAAEPSLP